MGLADDRGHAILAPSAAHRWLNCPGSVRASEQIPDETSDFAAEGTLAHEFCALVACSAFKLPYGGKALTKTKFNRTLNQLRKNELYSPEMEEYTDQYVEFIASLPERDLLFIEQQVDMTAYATDCWGTSDCIAVYGETLHVIDFKYGKGVKVSAESNPQMMLYALGALDYIDAFCPDINNIRMTIFQPRVGNVATCELSRVDLVEWGKSIFARALMAYQGEDKYCSGSWCRFCKVKKYCRHYADSIIDGVVNDKTVTPDPHRLSPDEMGQYYFRALACEKYIKEVKETVESIMLSGTPVKGLKLVEGRSKRIWTDTDEAIKVIKEAGYEVYKEPEFITLAQFEKNLGAKKFDELVGEYVAKQPGAPTVTGADDPRKEWRPYANDFDDIEPQA